MKKGNVAALLPIGVFLCIYLGLGIAFEYVMKIPMGFYNVPIIIAFLAAILVACLQNRKISFDGKLEIMAQGLADKNIITMLLIFLTAGAFVGVVGRSSAESVAYFMLSLIPARFSVAVLFVVACFVSVAMGTSVGTITLITPIAVSVSKASGFDMALCIGSVMGGSMFGDNLSFISDTTIAACNGQGCQMKDKFRENFGIALPAAIATLVLILVLSFQTDIAGRVSKSYNLVQIIPYVLVLIGGIIGINVFVVLLIGIVSGSIIMLAGGHIAATDLLANMGSGASGMFETSMVAILVAAMCALIREYGGFDALLGRNPQSIQRPQRRSVSVWDFWSERWILQRRIIQSQLLWQIQLQKKCQETTESAIRKQHLFWIHFPVSFRESFHMVHRCLWQFLQSMSWVENFLLFRSYRSFFIQCFFCLHPLLL